MCIRDSNLPAVDDVDELTSYDLLSGGSGNDVLIDMANKSSVTIVEDMGTTETSDDVSTTTTGEVVTLGGSGQDIIRIASDRNSMDFEGKIILRFDSYKIFLNQPISLELTHQRK